MAPVSAGASSRLWMGSGVGLYDPGMARSTAATYRVAAPKVLLELSTGKNNYIRLRRRAKGTEVYKPMDGWTDVVITFSSHAEDDNPTVIAGALDDVGDLSGSTENRMTLIVTIADARALPESGIYKITYTDDQSVPGEMMAGPYVVERGPGS